jgi:hypothetical protein
MTLVSIGKIKQRLKAKKMLSIEQCKKLIGDKTLSDKEVEEIRDELYILANLAFDHWKETRKPIGGQKTASKPALTE